MNKNIIIIPPNFTYGDILSIIGLVYFLLDYYENVYLYIECVPQHIKIYYYYIHFFNNCIFFNKKIFILLNDEIHNKLNNCNFGEFHICNTHTGEWNEPNYIFYNIPCIDKQFYFNDINPLFNKINIDNKFICNPNGNLPNNNLEINHLFYYKLIGLNNNVRMDFFNYSRDNEKEIFYKNKIKHQYNIHENEKYNIIHSSGEIFDINILKKYVNNDYKFIDIHNIVDFPGWLLLLIEEAECVNLIEGSNANFLYHCQYKNIIKITKPVHFYVFLRNRSWPYYNLCEAWKMMSTPILENWNFIFEDK
jgi:hypothetical protein